MSNTGGAFLLDPTLGAAHKIEETQESLLSTILKKAVWSCTRSSTLAGAALLVAIIKWLGMIFTRKPSQKRIRALLNAVAERNKKAAIEKAKAIKGPVGKMLQAGVDYLEEPRELVEEVMYEKMLSTRLKLERFLPFIAISAASAPLLGLLGTVTGIINTFKLITIFGSGDVKTLSGGISEALITTEFGLIVAIPSLLIHAFLSRNARGMINQMEKAGVALINQIGKTPYLPKLTKKETELLYRKEEKTLLPSLTGDPKPVFSESEKQYAKKEISTHTNHHMFSISKNATAAEAIQQIRQVGIQEEIDTLFVIDENGKFIGHAAAGSLLTCPEDTRIETLVEGHPRFVRVDAHESEVENSFNEHNLMRLPILDHDDQLVGHVSCAGSGKSNGNGNE